MQFCAFSFILTDALVALKTSPIYTDLQITQYTIHNQYVGYNNEQVT